jgi:hypothetical protein
VPVSSVPPRPADLHRSGETGSRRPARRRVRTGARPRRQAAARAGLELATSRSTHRRRGQGDRQWQRRAWAGRLRLQLPPLRPVVGDRVALVERSSEVSAAAWRPARAAPRTGRRLRCSDDQARARPADESQGMGLRGKLSAAGRTDATCPARPSEGGRRRRRTAGRTRTARSFTVLETSTCPAPASAETRAAMFTAIPPRSFSNISHSPVWTPARISTPSAPTAWCSASAQPTARAGPSNVAMKPSPNDFTSTPRQRWISLRTSWLCRSMIRASARLRHPPRAASIRRGR